MSAATIEPVVLDAMLSDIFLALLGEAEVLGTAAVDGQVPAVTGDSTLTASVSITGEWPGHVSVSCSDTFGRRFASRLFRSDAEADVSEADVVDALGELANVVGGNVKSAVPGPNVLSLPQVTRGTHYLPSAVESVRLDLSWAGEPLRVSVWTGSRPGGDAR